MLERGTRIIYYNIIDNNIDDDDDDNNDNENDSKIKNNNDYSNNPNNNRFMILFLTFVTETISRTDKGQPRSKYIFNTCRTNIYFFTLQSFVPSPSPIFKSIYSL